jgi:hypothetical protein
MMIIIIISSSSSSSSIGGGFNFNIIFVLSYFDSLCSSFPLLPTWQKQLWVVLSITYLHAFSMHQIASSSITAWTCFFLMHSIILSKICLQKSCLRLTTFWSMGCNMLAVFAGRNTSLMFSRFWSTGCAGQLSVSNRSFLFCGEVHSPRTSVQL